MDGNGDAPDGTLQPSPHVRGDVWAMAYPTSIAGNAADHTYLQGLDEEGQWYNWMCFGLETGGEEVVNTRTDMWADLTVVGFMAAQAPCKWPLTYYLRIGICHQCANRGLYFTGKTVAESRGYNFFVVIYGTYGEEIKSPYSMQRCLEAAPLWQGPTISSSAAIHSVAQWPELEEVELYRQYAAAAGGRGALVDEPILLRRAYLDALFAQRIRLQLGAGFCQQTIAALQSARNVFLDEKDSLEVWLTQTIVDELEVFNYYERLFNDLADRYRRLLTPDEYERLFNLDFESPIDLSWYLP